MQGLQKRLTLLIHQSGMAAVTLLCSKHSKKLLALKPHGHFCYKILPSDFTQTPCWAFGISRFPGHYKHITRSQLVANQEGALLPEAHALATHSM